MKGFLKTIAYLVVIIVGIRILTLTSSTSEPQRIIANSTSTPRPTLVSLTVAPTSPPASPTMRIILVPSSTPLPTDAPIPPTHTPTPTPIIEGLINSSANLRSGPGTDYEIVGGAPAGQVLRIVARNNAGDWYQTAEGAWVAAFLVNNPPPSLAIAAAPPLPTQPPVVEAPPTATVQPLVVEAPTATPAPQRFEAAPNPLSGQRYGAICRDGTTSGATGRGACSHHGGVAQWLTH